jgi:hypothetical protein
MNIFLLATTVGYAAVKAQDCFKLSESSYGVNNGTTNGTTVYNDRAILIDKVGEEDFQVSGIKVC